MKFRASYATVELDGMLEDEQAKELFAHFGRAIYAANILEHSVVNSLFIVELGAKIRDFKSRDEWETAYDKFYEEAFAQTYGNLLRRIERSDFLSPDLIETLAHTKTVRDHLVHRFARETAEFFYSKSGRCQIVEECDQATSLFDAIDVELEAEMAVIRPKLGIDEKILQERTEAAMLEMVKIAETDG